MIEPTPRRFAANAQPAIGGERAAQEEATHGERRSPWLDYQPVDELDRHGTGKILKLPSGNLT